MKTADQLNALPYQTAPFAAGLTASDYRDQHEAYGESFRLWRALEVAGGNRSGKIYQEVELGSIGKGRFRAADRDVAEESFGRVPQGTTVLSCLPEVAEIAAGDRVLRFAPGQERLEGATIVRGSSPLDFLPRRFVTEICLVSAGGVGIPLSQVEVQASSGPGDAQKGGLKWLGGAPALGAKVFVLYRYQPFYVCPGENMESAPVGADGGGLPRRVLLREERE